MGARRIDLTGIVGSAIGMRPKTVEHYRAKVFKSGNSLALRLPAELGLQAGTEMVLRVEDGEWYSFEPAQRPVRTIDVRKFAGKCTGLTVPVREPFDDPPRAWDHPDWPNFK